tara:strand:- start:230 stop:367 length:138 start_codon:yes stop_codon:yes gene_type:complete
MHQRGPEMNTTYDTDEWYEEEKAPWDYYPEDDNWLDIWRRYEDEK